MPTHGSLSKAGKVRSQTPKIGNSKEQRQAQKTEVDATTKSVLFCNGNLAKTGCTLHTEDSSSLHNLF